MNIFHTELIDRWKILTIYEQMANIGAEVGRTISWKKRNQARRRSPRKTPISMRANFADIFFIILKFYLKVACSRKL